MLRAGKPRAWPGLSRGKRAILCRASAPGTTRNPQLKFDFIAPSDVQIRSYNPSVKGHNKQIKKATQAILNAKKLVVYAGGGVIQSDTSDSLTTLVEKLNAPCKFGASQ